MRTLRPRRRTIALCALVPVLALGAGCGGDGDGEGGLSSRNKLDVFHARADILEYCTVQKGGSNVLTDRSLGILLDAVRDLVRVYRDQPNATVEMVAEKKTLTTQQVMQEQIRVLRKCGRYGRPQAGVLQAAVEQQAQS